MLKGIKKSLSRRKVNGGDSQPYLVDVSSNSMSGGDDNSRSSEPSPGRMGKLLRTSPLRRSQQKGQDDGSKSRGLPAAGSTDDAPESPNRSRVQDELNELRRKSLAKSIISKKKDDTATLTPEIDAFYLQQRKQNQEWKQQQIEASKYLHSYRLRNYEGGNKEGVEGAGSEYIILPFDQMSEIDRRYDELRRIGKLPTWMLLQTPNHVLSEETRMMKREELQKLGYQDDDMVLSTTDLDHHDIERPENTDEATEVLLVTAQKSFEERLDEIHNKEPDGVVEPPMSLAISLEDAAEISETPEEDVVKESKSIKVPAAGEPGVLPVGESVQGLENSEVPAAEEPAELVEGSKNSTVFTFEEEEITIDFPSAENEESMVEEDNTREDNGDDMLDDFDADLDALLEDDLDKLLGDDFDPDPETEPKPEPPKPVSPPKSKPKSKPEPKPKPSRQKAAPQPKPAPIPKLKPVPKPIQTVSPPKPSTTRRTNRRSTTAKARTSPSIPEASLPRVANWSRNGKSPNNSRITPPRSITASVKPPKPRSPLKSRFPAPEFIFGQNVSPRPLPPSDSSIASLNSPAHCIPAISPDKSAKSSTSRRQSHSSGKTKRVFRRFDDESVLPTCSNRWQTNLHPNRAGCDRCLHFCTGAARRRFELDGHHYSVNVTKGGCPGNCALFPRHDGTPIRLCRKCFHDTHRR